MQRYLLPEYFENAAIALPHDFDDDGDIDLFVGSNAVSNDFGNIPNSLLLKNENGLFEVVDHPTLQNAGMISDALWHDFDKDVCFLEFIYTYMY